MTPTGTIRYWAAARDAAGCTDEAYAAATLDAALVAAARGRDAAFAAVLRRCSFLVDGAPVGKRAHADIALREGGVVEVLPPFAGG